MLGMPGLIIKCATCGLDVSWEKAWREPLTKALVCGKVCLDDLQKRYATELVESVKKK